MSFYQQVHDLAKNSSLYTRDTVANTQLIFNPGESDVPEVYIPYADTFITFEGTADSYQSFQPAAYTNNYDTSKFWHIVHTCETSAAVNATLVQFNSQHAEFLYLTDLIEPNPYNDLPSTDVWAQELAYISNNT